jgi:hypothetical protein
MKLKRTIINAANKYISVSSVKNKTTNIPPDVLDLIKGRNALLRLRQKHRHLVLPRVITNIRSEIQSKIKIPKNIEWTNSMNKLEINDHSAWKVVRAVTRTKTITPPLHHPTTPNEYVCDPQKKCELIEDTLCSSFQPNPVTAENATHAKEVDDFANSLQQPGGSASINTSGSKFKT